MPSTEISARSGAGPGDQDQGLLGGHWRGQLANVYRRKGEYQRALDLSEAAFEINARFYEADHPVLAAILANHYRDRGQSRA